MAISPDLGEEQILKMNPGYRIIGDIKVNYYEENGWYIHVELMKNT